MIQGKAEKLYLGNITTMDDIKPFAKAMTVVGDRYRRFCQETRHALS